MSIQRENMLIATVAFLSGVLNSLIGAGGGILLTSATSKLFPDRFSDRRDLYVNSQASMIPGCALSFGIYASEGHFSIAAALPLAISAAIGGVLGSMLLARINSTVIGRIFASLVIFSGLRMIIG